MKRAIIFSAFHVMYFLSVVNSSADWELEKKINLANTINCSRTWGMKYSKEINKLIIPGGITFHCDIFDPLTLVGVGQIYVGGGKYSIEVDDTRNRLYSVAPYGISISDFVANKMLHELSFEDYTINHRTFAVDKTDNVLFFVTSIKTEEETPFLISVDGETFEEVSRIPIPKDLPVVLADAPTPKYYKDVFVDEINKYAYLAVIEQENDGFVDVAPDTVYVFDTKKNTLISRIPVLGGPRYIDKNYSTGDIVIYSNENRYYDSNPLKSGDKGLITIIDSNTLEKKGSVELSEKYVSLEFAIAEQHNLIYCAGNIISIERQEVIGEHKLSKNISWCYNTIYDDKNNEVYECDSNTLHVFDAVTGESLRVAETGIGIYDSDYSNLNNEFYFLYSPDGFKFGVVDLANKIIKKVIDINKWVINFVCDSTNSNLYAVSNNSVFIYNPLTEQIVKENNTSIEKNINDIQVDNVTNQLYVLTGKENENESYLYIFDTYSLMFKDRISLDLQNAREMEIDSNNHNIYIRDEFPFYENENNTILVINGDTRKEVSSHSIEKMLWGDGKICLSEAKGVLYVSTKNKIIVFEAETFEVLDTIDIASGWDCNLTFYELTNELFVRLYNKVIIIDGSTYEIKQTVSQFLSTDPRCTPFFNSITNEYVTVGISEAAIQTYENLKYPGYIPPSAPSSLTATQAESAIILSWPPVDHSDVQGYKVYRSPAVADQWTKLNTELVTYTSFLDETAVPNTPYDYYVRTTGLYNISSGPSAPVTATLIIDPDFTLSSILASQSTEKDATIEYIITSESIEQFATLIDMIVEGLPEDLTATLSTPQLRPGDVASLTLDVAEDFAPDIYEFEVVGIAEGIEHRVPLTLNVVETEQEESAITLSLSSKSIEFGDAIFATGRIIPEVSAPVSLVFMSSSETQTVSTTSLSDGTFSLDFEPETSGEWSVLASWAGNDDYSGATSEQKVFDALSGQTKITCTTDVSADAEVGWQMTVKGTVFPNPGVGDVVLYVTKPDGTKETVDGLKINELGYYGYNITADQPGFWEVTAGWAGNSKYLGSVSETLIVPYGLDIGRAIIVVSPKQNKPFYYTANRLGNLAYQTFSKRRFDNPRIKYFDIDTTQDLNDDGFTGDVDGEPTLENVTEAISTWSAAAVNEETPLCIYLIGEGSLDGIELSDGNLLTASYLADLLSDVETTTGCDDVIVVVDAPHSGKFVSELSKLGRCVVTSTNLGKSNYIGNGKLSFSQYFLNYAYQGKSLRDSFLYTKRVLSNLPGAFKKQEPQVEGEGNLFANESSDFLKTANWYFGSSYGLQDLMPRVKSMSLASVTGQGGGVGKIVTNTHNVLSGERTPSLKLAKSVAAQGVDVWVRVDDAESNISSVFATVFSPQDSVLQEVELFDPDSDGKYEGIVYGLDDIGAYDIVAYAFDESENVSEPMKSLVMVVERDVVLEPPTDVRVDDVPGDNGYQVNVSWGQSPSEESGDVGWYRIYRSRKGELTSPISLSQFTSIDTLNFYEENYTILVDSVAVGQIEYIDSVPLNGVNYYYWVQASGTTGASKKVAADMPTYVNSMPKGFVVHQPYPNPFNPSTTIRYELSSETHVEFVVYDVLGRKVKVLKDGVMEAGNHEIVWDGIDRDGMDVGSGMYFYQVKAGEAVKKGKMVLVR